MTTSLKIGILGTRGIPNVYGGFEQFAQYLSAGLVQKGHRVWVYNSDQHPYQESEWKGVQIIHCKDWEHRLGTVGQFFYDYNCLSDARKREFDILLQLGYTSNSIWFLKWPQKMVNIVNMDGLEWKRSKYGHLTKRFLKYAEKLAAVHADLLIADSVGIQDYLKSEYRKASVYIPYGADIFHPVDRRALDAYQLQAGGYNLLIARMEPENNIEMILKGYLASDKKNPLVAIGNTENKYGLWLRSKYKDPKIRFPGAVYDHNTLNTLRYYSALYFHGHSVGGTNPSLLEAMSCGCRIAAHNNIFNRAILTDCAYYFSHAEDITSILDTKNDDAGLVREWKSKNCEKIKNEYSWPRIIEEYEKVFLLADEKRHADKTGNHKL